MCLHPRANPARLWDSCCANLAPHHLCAMVITICCGLKGGRFAVPCIPMQRHLRLCAQGSRWEGPMSRASRWPEHCGHQDGTQVWPRGGLAPQEHGVSAAACLPSATCCIPVGEKKSRLTASCEVKGGGCFSQ